jgi:ABC-type transport system substrate-binding protein
LDDYTLRVNLVTFRNTDVTGFDGGQYAIFSKASFDKNGLDYTRSHPIGTGPFLFDQYVKDSKITFTRNPTGIQFCHIWTNWRWLSFPKKLCVNYYSNEVTFASSVPHPN